jgi:hypothetical protein
MQVDIGCDEACIFLVWRRLSVDTNGLPYEPTNSLVCPFHCLRLALCIPAGSTSGTIQLQTAVN